MKTLFTSLAFSVLSVVLIGCQSKYQIEKYTSGKIKSQAALIYVNDNPIKSGRYFELFENGDTSLTGFYKQDKKDSVWHEYSLSHAEIKRSIYQDDSLLGQYSGDELALIIKGYQLINARILYVPDNFYSSLLGNKRNTRSDGIENLKIYKSVDSGNLVITFDYLNTWPKKYTLIPSCFRFNLLDKNGLELNSWRSEEFYIPEAKFKMLLANSLYMPFGAKLERLKSQGNFITYKENQKDIQFLETVEFGISGLDYNPSARLPYGGIFSF